jgi:hypothetical protein
MRRLRLWGMGSLLSDRLFFACAALWVFAFCVGLSLISYWSVLAVLLWRWPFLDLLLVY